MMSEGVLVAIIGIIGLITTSIFSFRSLKATLKNNLDLAIMQLQKQQEETHKLVNSRMSELLELTKKAAEAEGKLQGIVEQKVITVAEVKAAEVKAEVLAVEVKAAGPPGPITNIKNVEIANVENVENVETLITKAKQQEEENNPEA